MLAGSATRVAKLLAGDGWSTVYLQVGIHDHIIGLVVTLSDTIHNLIPSGLTFIAPIILNHFDKDSGFEQTEASLIFIIALAEEHRRQLFAFQVLGQEQHPAARSGSPQVHFSQASLSPKPQHTLFGQYHLL